MNKKKRALALGLAATQLTALSAVVAPLTAFAEDKVEATGIVTGAVITGSSEYYEARLEGNTLYYKVKKDDTTGLPVTPEEPAYPACGVKLTMSEGDKVAMAGSTMGLAGVGDAQADGFVLWLSALKSADMDLEFRKYEKSVIKEDDGNSVLFYASEDGTTKGNALTKTAKVNYYDGNQYDGFAYVSDDDSATQTQTIKIVREMAIVPALDAKVVSNCSATSEAKAIAALQEAVDNGLLSFTEYDEDLTSLQKSRDYTVTITKSSDQSIPQMRGADGEGGTWVNFDVKITFNNTMRSGLLFANPGESGNYKVADEGKTAILTARVAIQSAIPVTVALESESFENSNVIKGITDIKGDDEADLINDAKDALTSEILNTLVTVKMDETPLSAGNEYTVALKEGSTGTVVTDSDNKATGVKFTIVVTLDPPFETTAGATTKEFDVIVPGSIRVAPTATVTLNTEGLIGATNADVTFKKGDDAFDIANGTVKAGDVLTMTVAPKTNYEFKTEPTVTVTNATSSKTDSTFTITVGDLAEDTENKVTITLAGEVVKSANVDFVTVSKGDKDPSTMSGSELTRYKENREKYTVTLDKATSTVKISAAVGSMKGETTAGSPAKNALVIVEMAEKDANLKVFKGDTEITDRSWYEDGSKFLESGSEDKGYVTLWISLTDDRMNGTEPVVYKFKSGKVEKTLTVTFEDTTEYELKAPDLTDAEYTVEITNPAAGKTEATVTVTPKDGGVITNAVVCGVTLTPSGDGYTGKVDIKNQLTNAQKEAGTTEITLVKDDTLNVTVAARSDINAVAITKATENPATMDSTELERYQKNHALYTVTYDSTNKVATVKVPSALMSGTGATGSGAANVCLVMKLDAALTADQKTAIISKGQIETVDIADGWKFVDGATEADADKYIVLWIGAGTAAITGDTKIVIYEDNGTNGKVIATVNLVKIPVVTTSATTLTRVDLADKTAAEQETAIITEAKKKLTLPTGVTEADLTFAVGTIPTNDTAAPVDGDVTVTVTSGNADVLLGKDGAKVTELEITVPVTVPAAPTKYEITKADATNGSFTVTPTTAAEGEAVSIAASPASGYVLDKITVTKTDDSETTVTMKTATTFEMPAYDVTVTVTFKKSSSGSSSSGGGSSRPSGGSSRPSGGGSSSSSVDISSTISAAAKGSTITVPSGKLNLTASELDAATKNDVTIIVPVNSTYSWTVRPSALPTIGAGLTLAVSEGQTVSQLEIIKIKGEPITNIMSFKTYANNLGDAAKLTVTTPVKSTTSQTKFANLYRIADNGALEFVEVVKIDAEGKAVLPMKDSGKYALLVSNESKMPGDINNDCTLNVTDAVTTIDRILNNIQNSEGDLAKLDLNGDGAVNVLDAVIIVNTILGKN